MSSEQITEIRRRYYSSKVKIGPYESTNTLGEEFGCSEVSALINFRQRPSDSDVRMVAALWHANPAKASGFGIHGGLVEAIKRLAGKDDIFDALGVLAEGDAYRPDNPLKLPLSVFEAEPWILKVVREGNCDSRAQEIVLGLVRMASSIVIAFGEHSPRWFREIVETAENGPEDHL